MLYYTDIANSILRSSYNAIRHESQGSDWLQKIWVSHGDFVVKLKKKFLPMDRDIAVYILINNTIISATH